MPLLRIVRVGIVENDQALQNGTSEDCLCCYSCDPGQARQPSHEVAQDFLITLRSKHVDPVVLASSDWCNGRQL